MGLSKLSDEKINLCREMRLNNISIKKIAKELQISPATVLRYVNDIKLDDDTLANLRSEGAKEGHKNKIKSDAKLKAAELWNNKQTLNIHSEDYNPVKIGNITTLKIMTAFCINDYFVYTPMGEGYKTDLVIENYKENKYYRIQCKTGRILKNGASFEFPACSVNWNTKKKMSYKGFCDLFAIYLRELDNVYLIGVDQCPVNSVRFCLFKELCLSNSRFADDYLFDGSRDISEYM